MARFTATQKTAFRKLLKKYKKWTGSTKLEERFNTDVLGRSSSFTKYSMDDLLDSYSVTLHGIRALFDQRMQQMVSREDGSETASSDHRSQTQTTVSQLLQAVETESKVALDSAIATTPFGDKGAIAHYFVHPDNVVELQVLLLQHTRYSMSSGRGSVSSTPLANSPSRDSPATSRASHLNINRRHLVADDLDRFVQEQRTITVNTREHAKGSIPQKALICARWTTDEEPTVAARTDSSEVKLAGVKRKHLSAFLDPQAAYPPRRGSTPTAPERASVSFEDALAMRTWLGSRPNICPLAAIVSKRSRFVGLTNSANSVLIATLDTDVATMKPFAEELVEDVQSFPYAVLQVRQEGNPSTDLIKELDSSHLVSIPACSPR